MYTMFPRETYKLRDWVDPTKFGRQFSGNPHAHAVQMLEERPETIDWLYLSGNPCAVHLLEKHPEKIVWEQLSYNWRAMHLVEQNPDKIDYWDFVSKFSCIDDMRRIIEEHLDSVEELLELVTALNEERANATPAVPPLFVPRDNLNWSSLSYGSYVMHLLEKYPNKIDWSCLSRNSHPRAIRLLEKHPEKINWSKLSSNTSPEAIRILEQNLDKVDWWYLSANKGAKHILEQHPEKIEWLYLCNNRSDWAMEMVKTELKRNAVNIAWVYLSGNPFIFEFNDEPYKYEEMKQSKQSLHEDLMRRIFHPDNLPKLAGWGIESGFDHDE